MKNHLFYLLLILIAKPGFTQIAVGQWRDHLPYKSGISVAEAGSRIYCATPYSLFYFEKSDNSIEKLSKVNGLSETGISKISYSENLKTLVIAYTNTRIDLIKNNQIVNIFDIYRKQILGNKSIHNILIQNNLAYLSCGFGIVVLDIEKEEIRDTYYIGLNGSYLNVYDLTLNDTAFFAATENGIYSASLNSPNLADFASWKRMTNIPNFTASFDQIESFSNKIIVNKPNPAYNDDIIYSFNGTSWEVFLQEDPSDISDIIAENNQLLFCRNMDVMVYNQQLLLEKKIWSPNQQNIFPNTAIIDQDHNIWIGDHKNALIKTSGDGWSGDFIRLNGPDFIDVFSMKTAGNDLWVASGGRSSVWAPLFKQQGIYSFVEGQWNSYHCFTDDCTSPELENIQDILSIGINPANRNQVFAGTWQKGLLEFNNGSLSSIYNDENSSLGRWNADPTRILISDLAFDDDGNLWVANSGANDLLSVKTPEGIWKSFNLGSAYSGIDISNILIDSQNQKWLILRKSNSLLVFNDNNTIEDISDDQVKVLSSASGNGNLFASEIVCLAEDLEGELWIGTNEGVGLIYSPGNVFGGGNFDARRILVEWDNYVQYLLETERITSIVVDGANRKWVGTESSGVYLLSEDGSTQIEHFTAENSPLFSNTIHAMAINKEGEIFFGTAKGIVSYRTDASDAANIGEEIYAFPNPVREDYTGPVTIKNIPREAVVKITDISGDLVYETRSLGGQASWNGKLANGQRAKTGVYLVFVSNMDGSETMITKILFIN